MVINPKCCLPTEGYYAVVRMDPETMLRAVNLDDQRALDEVRRMEPKKYLVYLAMVSIQSIVCYPLCVPAYAAGDQWQWQRFPSPAYLRRVGNTCVAVFWEHLSQARRPEPPPLLRQLR